MAVLSCFRPIAAWRASGGAPVLTRRLGDVDRPVSLPCGKCAGCYLDWRRDWSIRISHAVRECDEPSSFLTMTYEDKRLPEDGSLKKEHTQTFWKRLRYHYGKLSYFCAGEYGPTTKRPHYHAIVIGQAFEDDRRLWKYTERGDPLWRSEKLEKVWNHGAVYIGRSDPASIAYVAGYVQKKAERAVHREERQEEWREAIQRLTEEVYVPPEKMIFRLDARTGEIDARTPEFFTMSRNPAIGKEYYERHREEIYRRDEVVFDGKAMKPPRYYDQLLKEKFPEKHREVMTRRRRRATTPERVKERSDPARRAIREEVAEARAALFSPRNEH